MLDAAVAVLGRRPEASVEEIATAAGVSRQTVYAHYPSREVLLATVIDRITEEAVAAMDAAALDEGPAAAAILRLLDVSWRTFERYPLLLHPAATSTSQRESHDQHGPVLDRLERLIRRGQDTGEFDRRPSPTWLLAATIGLGHAAGAEVAAGRMPAGQAADALRHSVLRILGADDQLSI